MKQHLKLAALILLYWGPAVVIIFLDFPPWRFAAATFWLIVLSVILTWMTPYIAKWLIK